MLLHQGQHLQLFVACDGPDAIGGSNCSRDMVHTIKLMEYLELRQLIT
jgi:hypothetical protein